MKINSISTQSFSGRCRVIDSPKVRKLYESYAPKKDVKNFKKEIKRLVRYIKKHTPMFSKYNLSFSNILKSDKENTYFFDVYLRNADKRVVTSGAIPFPSKESAKTFDYDSALKVFKKECDRIKAIVKRKNEKFDDF